MSESLIRPSLRDLVPAFGQAQRPEARGLVNMRDNENVFAGAQLRYPDNHAEDLARRYRLALDSIETRTQAAPPDDDPPPLLTRGASDALDLIFRAFFEPGRDAVATTPPTFRLFDELARVYAVDVRRYPLCGPRLDRIDADALAAAPVKGYLLCDPNNPVGSSLDPLDVGRLLREREKLVVVDEAYVEYSQRASYRHWVAQHPNLVVVRSMSKALGMAGLRLGAVFAAPHLLAALRKVRLPFALPRPVIEAAAAELAQPQRLRAQIDRFVAERDRLADALLGCPCVEAVHAGAGFVSVRADERVAARLLRAGFDTVCAPMGWSGHIRISVAEPEHNQRLVDTLRQA